MPYCVNCGVELEKSQQKCPLCGVEVNNPAEPYDPDWPKPYSSHIVRVQAKVERRFLAWIITILILLISAVCIIANFVYQGEMTWSLYVVSSLMMAWVLIILPLLHTGLHPVVAIMLDVCALLGFLYLLNVASPSSDWYETLAMPQVLLYAVLALIDVIAWKSKRIHGWQRYGIISFSIGIAMLGLEVLLDLYNDMHIALDWSWFVFVPTFAIGIIFFLLERKREVKDEIIRRLRV